MRVIRAKDYDDMSRKAAWLIASQVQLHPACVLGLATGSSPVGAYKQLIEWYRAGELDFSAATSINLDEYVGLGGDSDQSYRRFMDENLFDHINIDKRNTFVPNGLAADGEAECARYEALIMEKGVDLQLLGLGNNGHIGFNEPADAFVPATHKVALTESTIQANRRFFEKEEDVPRFAYTTGIRGIMQAKRVVVVVSGAAKAQAVKDALTGPVTPQMPGSILQLHADCTLVADEAALALL